MTKQIELTAEQKKECSAIVWASYDGNAAAQEAMRRGIAIGRAEAQAGEPTIWQCRVRADWQKEWSAWTECTAGQADDYRRSPFVSNWHYEVRALYTAPQPQQQGVISAEDYLRKEYGSYRGHYAWRALEAAFNAGFATRQRPEPTPVRDALKDLLWQVEEFASQHGEADFETEHAHAALEAEQPAPQPQGEAWRKRRLISMPKIDEPSLRVVGFVVGKNEFDPLGLPASIIESIIAAPQQPEPSAELSDALDVLEEICDMQRKYHGDGISTHLRLMKLCDDGREALAALETKRGRS